MNKENYTVYVDHLKTSKTDLCQNGRTLTIGSLIRVLNFIYIYIYIYIYTHTHIYIYIYIYI